MPDTFFAALIPICVITICILCILILTNYDQLVEKYGHGLGISLLIYILSAMIMCALGVAKCAIFIIEFMRTL
jgi:hypothetical protein